MDISLSAAHPESDGGWVFSGSTVAGQKIPIGRLLQDLVTLFGPFSLPNPVASLELDRLGATFDTDTKDFTFRCEATFQVDSAPPAELPSSQELLPAAVT